jgi:hypothetical protein
MVVTPIVKDECNHGTNLLSTVKLKRGTMERDSHYVETFDSVENVQEDVYRLIRRAYQSHDKRCYIIKAITGAGKSHSYLKLMSGNPSERFLIAAPTNLLKDEIYEKAKKLGISVRKTPSLEQIKDEIPPKVQRQIERLYQNGQHRSVHPYIRELLNKKKIPCLQEYMEEREKLKGFKGSLITTHRYLLSMDKKRQLEYDAIIIDEDIILKSIISNQGEITVSELKKLSGKTSDLQVKKKIEKLLKLYKTETCIEAESFEYEYEEDDEGDCKKKGRKVIPFDIPSFCLAEKFYVRRTSKERNLNEDTLAFIKPGTLHEDVRYIVVSATADEGIYRKIFGEDNVDFQECKKAEYKGGLYQYPNKSYSRSSIDNDPGIIERLIKRFGIDEDKVITFMKYSKGLLHFGNTEGSNEFEGKDILVIGTPYHTEFLYKLVAFNYGFDFDEAAEMNPQRISHNGYFSMFNTFKDESLRKIQLWMIESELEQAVGRPRLLRYECKVHLFSNFPLSYQAKVINDFDCDKDAVPPAN